jgi:isopenicillin-N epimerase
VSSTDAARRLWSLDSEVAHLNHASYGAVPRSVQKVRHDLLQEVEGNPNRVLRYQLGARFADVRSALARACGVDAGGLCFVESVTSGVAAVMASFPLRAGQQVVVADDVYSSVHVAVAQACGRGGADMKVVPVPFLASGAEAAAAVLDAITPATVLVVVDQVSSLTARLWPVAEMAAELRTRRVPVLVDGAHALGPLRDPAAVGASFWVGNCHKWLGAPKGSAVLWVDEAWRDRMRPAVPSHGNGLPFPASFDWRGTHDVTPVLSLPAALSFWQSLGGDAAWRRAAVLAESFASQVQSRWGGETSPDSGTLPMVLVEVPRSVVPPERLGEACRWLSDVAKVEAVGWPGAGRGWIRLSSPVYSSATDVERLLTRSPRFRLTSALDGACRQATDDEPLERQEQDEHRR